MGEDGTIWRANFQDAAGTTLEATFLPGKAPQASLRIPLASPVTGLISHDMPERLAATQARLQLAISRPAANHIAANVPAIRQALALLSQVCAMACTQGDALALHWKQSEQLLPPAAFLELANEGVPGALHVHPFLFGGDGQVGIRTFGMRHFIGREMLLQPHGDDFTGHFEAMLAFLRHALSPGGELIPDGDSFSLPDGGQRYQVLHLAGADDGVPLIELLPID